MQTPIVALTANTTPEQQRHYRASGMSGVVSKPISPTLLLTEIFKLAQSEAA